MIERLEQILKEFNLSASRFSERLGIQRSGLSHILAGRNKPSYDFLVKLAEEFPEINTNWLLTGKGSMFTEEVEQGNDLFNQPDNVDAEPGIQTDKTEMSGDDKSLANDGYCKVYNGKQLSFTGEIEHIVIFYSNGQYRRFVGE